MFVLIFFPFRINIAFINQRLYQVFVGDIDA